MSRKQYDFLWEFRIASLYHPNGVNVDKWTPVGDGKDYQCNETQKPFAKYKNDFQIISGLDFWIIVDLLNQQGRFGRVQKNPEKRKK